MPYPLFLYVKFLQNWVVIDYDMDFVLEIIEEYHSGIINGN